MPLTTELWGGLEKPKEAIFSLQNEMMVKIVFWALMFVAIGGACFAGFALFAVFFAFSGELMTKRLRQKSFDKLLHLDVAYFDWPENSVGALCSRLATDASLVQGAIGTRIGKGITVFCV